MQVLDHLADGDGFFVDLEDRAGAGAIQNLLESLDEVDDIGGEFRLGAFGVHEFADGRIAEDGVFDLLLLEEHLSGGLEFLVLEKAIDEFVARIFLRVGGKERVAGQQHLGFDVD